MNTAEIISKVTMTLSLINSNNDFDSVLVELCILFSQYKISLPSRNTHDVGSFLALVKIVAESQHKIFVDK